MVSPETEVQPVKEVVVDQERVDQVLGRLMIAYEDKKHPYYLDSARLPQDHRHMPEDMEFGSREHAMFMFHSCLWMRGGTRSVDAFRGLTRLFNRDRDLFDAEYAAEKPEAYIGRQVMMSGLGFWKRVGKEWRTNSERLLERHDGDPRKIFDGVSDYDEACLRIRNDNKGNGFIGFQKKMTSMLTYYLMDEKMIDEFQFPLPVDVHVMRITVATEMIKLIGFAEDENHLTDAIQDIVRGIYYRYAIENNVSSLRLCDAVWLLSMASCSRQPGNITLEPEGRENRRGRSTRLEPLPIEPWNYTQRKWYTETCGQCPIEDLCKWDVPNKSNYIHGGQARRGRRFRFPMLPIQEELIEIPDSVLSENRRLRRSRPPVSAPRDSEIPPTEPPDTLFDY